MGRVEHSKLPANALRCNSALGSDRSEPEAFPYERRDLSKSVRSLRVEACRFGAAEPGELALRKLPSSRDPACVKLRRIDIAVEVRPGLPVADAAHRRHPGSERVALAQTAQLGDQPGGQHRLEAQSDIAVETSAIRREQRDPDQWSDVIAFGTASLQLRQRHTR